MLQYNKYNQLTETKKKVIQELAASRHIRNCVVHEDGSYGEIRITHKELLNLLTEAYLIGYNDD